MVQKRATAPDDADEAFVGIDNAPLKEPLPDPEVLLWRAVICQCWNDAFLLSDTAIYNTDRTAEPVAVRTVARNWLVSDLEPFRSDREEICAAADIDADCIRDAAKRRLALARGDDVAREARAHRKAVARMDAMLKDLLSSAEDLSPAVVEFQLRKLAKVEWESIG